MLVETHLDKAAVVADDVQGPGVLQVLVHVDDGRHLVRVRPIGVVLRQGAWSRIWTGKLQFEGNEQFKTCDVLEKPGTQAGNTGSR